MAQMVGPVNVDDSGIRVSHAFERNCGSGGGGLGGRIQQSHDRLRGQACGEGHGRDGENCIY